MIIEITEGVNWDTENLLNEEARQWINERVMQRDADECDRFGRPVRWVEETDTSVVSVEREYINPNNGSWAKRRDVINVTGKGGDA